MRVGIQLITLFMFNFKRQIRLNNMYVCHKGLSKKSIFPAFKVDEKSNRKTLFLICLILMGAVINKTSQHCMNAICSSKLQGVKS